MVTDVPNDTIRNGRIPRAINPGRLDELADLLASGRPGARSRVEMELRHMERRVGRVEQELRRMERSARLAADD